MGAQLPFCFTAPQMAVVSEGQHVPPAMLTGYCVRQIIRHHRIAHPEKSDKPLARVRRSGHAGMVVQQLPGHRCILHGFQIAVLVALRHQFGAAYAQFCNEILRLDPQRCRGRRQAHRLAWVHHRSGVLPRGVLTEKPVDPFAIPLAAGAVDRGQVIENEVQGLAGTIGAHHLGRAVEAVEPEGDAMGRIGVVAPHPLHELPVRVEPAEAVAEPGLLHILI